MLHAKDFLAIRTLNYSLLGHYIYAEFALKDFNRVSVYVGKFGIICAKAKGKHVLNISDDATAYIRREIVRKGLKAIDLFKQSGKAI